MVSPFIDGGPGTGPHVMMHAAFMVFYFLCTFAIIIVVLDRARSETATLKEFNERLVDGLGEGLQLVDGDFRIRHANRWMHGQLGPISDLNGVEAMDGCGRLGIAVSLAGAQVGIATSDTGRGMPSEERRRVFEPFYSKKPAGTGLGLTIARRIVAAHGGRIEIDSTPGLGACFTILLPLGEQDDDGDDSRRR
jgi:hypothetical protein